MCFAATQAIDYWLVDSSGSDCWYGGFDAESDFEVDKLQGIHVLRNTFRDYSSFAIWTPVPRANDNTRDIEIRNNVIETRPDGVCNQMILVGAYPNNPNQIYNAVVENNTLKERSGPGVVFDHVNGGSIRNNRDENYIEATCGHPNAIPFSRLTNSTGVVVENNGPNAAGAGGSLPPPPPPPPEGGSLALTAAASPSSGAAPLGVSFTYTLANNGSDTLFRVSLVDEGCSPAAYGSGDANKDTLLQPGETWKFTCSRTFAAAGSYTSRATAGGTSSKTGLPVNSNTAQTAVTVN
jgi:hypothetical protein